MIKSIEIENFRGFHQTKAKGFAQLNLIGGRNNAGKTAFLESLFLMGVPAHDTVRRLLSFRRISERFIKENPEKAWDNLFFKQEKSQIKLSFSFVNDHDNYFVLINSDDDVSEFIDGFGVDEAESDEDLDKDLSAFLKSIDSPSMAKSSLHIKSYHNAIEGKPESDNIVVCSSQGIVGKGFKKAIIDVSFIPASMRASSSSLAKLFDKAKYDGNSDLLLSMFQSIDSTIVDIDTFNIGDSSIYLKRKNENYMPLSLFGDALSRVADIVLKVVNKRNGLLLIDEIENGIHHENHEEFWDMLFRLCSDFNVQLFATTHSLEMIGAFKNSIIKNEISDGSYFEMARHPVSNEIIFQGISINSLESKLINNEPIRGE